MVELKRWLNSKLKELEAGGINCDRIIFDPGIGFGKTTAQSIQILSQINELNHLPIRIMIGHSRKSFIRSFGAERPQDRDAATLALSLELAAHGVDILRIHDFESHVPALRARLENL